MNTNMNSTTNNTNAASIPTAKAKLSKIGTTMSGYITNLKSNSAAASKTASQVATKVSSIIRKITRRICLLIIIGFVVSLLASTVWPEFSEKFPTVYGWFNGWAQVGEFLYRAFFGLIKAILQWDFASYWHNLSEATRSGVSQFFDWVCSVGF